MSISCIKLGKFSVIIFSNKFSTSHSLSSPSVTPMMQCCNAEVVPEAVYTILIFFWILFSFVLLTGCFLHPYIPNC